MSSFEVSALQSSLEQSDSIELSFSIAVSVNAAIEHGLGHRLIDTSGLLCRLRFSLGYVGVDAPPRHLANVHVIRGLGMAAYLVSTPF